MGKRWFRIAETVEGRGRMLKSYALRKVQSTPSLRGGIGYLGYMPGHTLAWVPSLWNMQRCDAHVTGLAL
jgi:hypothetical protein